MSVDGERAGRADFIDAAKGKNERIFFHTEVDEQFGGRGLAGLLVREALADSIRENLVVVPVCPLFASHLEKHGDEFLAGGGAFRKPSSDDIALVRLAAQPNS
ncbi:MAG: GNAT family N-acetyltransferase [Rhodococcus sp. (in: high G+C Gram-positive bacteria)]